MSEIELLPEEITEDDNTTHVEMNIKEIAFLKRFIMEYKPKKDC